MNHRIFLLLENRVMLNLTLKISTNSFYLSYVNSTAARNYDVSLISSPANEDNILQCIFDQARLSPTRGIICVGDPKVSKCGGVKRFSLTRICCC